MPSPSDPFLIGKDDRALLGALAAFVYATEAHIAAGEAEKPELPRDVDAVA